MARRGHNDEITLALSACNSKLEQLAKRVHDDRKEFSVENTLRLKEDIFNLAKETAAAAHTTGTTRSVIEEQKNTRSNDTQESALCEKMKLAITSMIGNYDSKNSASVRNIASILKMDGEEDDIELMEGEKLESHYNCPYTTLRMVDPMKNGKCIHRVSRVAITEMLKKGRCIIPGCGAVWNSQNAKPDPEFQKEMDEFFASRATATASSSSAANAMDEEYQRL